MNNSQKILKMLSGFIESGILTSKDLKKELLTSLKFKKEDLVNKLDLVKREELLVLKKLNFPSLVCHPTTLSLTSYGLCAATQTISGNGGAGSLLYSPLCPLYFGLR